MATISSCLFRLRSEVIRWIRHHIYFTKPASFLLGLVFAHGLAKNAVEDVLILYLIDKWEQHNLMKAAAIVNIEEAISGVIAILIYLLTESWVGRFKMVLFSTASFILGLVLLWLSTWVFSSGIKAPMLYVALLLITFGKAGKDPPFKNFVRDQLFGKDDKQVDDRAEFLWRVFKFLGAIVAVFFLTPKSWKETFFISALVMGIAYLMFLAGIFCSYNRKPPTRNPLTVLYKVVKSAFTKRGLTYPRTPSGYFLNQRSEQPLFPLDSILRCIDKAAILEQASPRQELQVESTDENLCSVAEVREAKSLIRLIPLWFAFFLYGIVTAAGSTFFIEQSNGLDDHIGNNFVLPVNSFCIMTSFTASVASFLANLVISKFCNRNETWILKGGFIRVGLGLIVSVLCCQTAYQIEHARLDQIRKYGDPDTKNGLVLHMSILWLAPQFILLGLMDGLSQDGLTELFYVLVDESMEGLETPINELMLEIGKLVSVACVFVFRSWFHDTINKSRLDKYFNMLTYLSAGNLVFYLVIGLYYVHVQKKEAQFESEHPQRKPKKQKQEGEEGEEEEEGNDIINTVVELVTSKQKQEGEEEGNDIINAVVELVTRHH